MAAAHGGTEVRTFLFADIRGYTAFTREQGDEAAARLTGRFAEIAREVVQAHEGDVTELRGDEALAVFVSPRSGLRAAVALQLRFQKEFEDDASLPFRVGMGLDAGEAVQIAGGYRGGALNLAARLCARAASGEIFATEGLIHLAGAMDDVRCVDRGQVELKGFPDPVRVIEVRSQASAPRDAPQFVLRATQMCNNLPAQPTPFIGRERELDEIAQTLRRPHVRLLTLTGPGGTGKTRLALQAAAQAADLFTDGVFFVALASLGSADLVPAAIARAIGLTEGGGVVEDRIRVRLRDKRLLLLLDTMEHVLDAATWLADLLANCPQLVVLATSREVLRLASEYHYAVPALSLPDLEHLPDLDQMSQFDAVALFVQRAQAARSSFTLTNENVSATAEICTRLDGLPLAIELAAARIRLFPPTALLKRLGDRLALLTGGARDLPARQQTLRGAIDWSYSLLDVREAQLFAHLSVFAGGCTLESAEAVCSVDGEPDVLEGMSSLVEKSLVVQEGEDEPRFRMLETIRAYATERLELSGEVEKFRQVHADHFFSLAKSARPNLFGSEQRMWLDRLRAEEANCWVAIDWLLSTGEVETVLLFVDALSYFWYLFGYFSEGRRVIVEALATGSPLAAPLRIQALDTAGYFATNQNDLAAAETLSREALELSRAQKDRGLLCSVLNTRGFVLHQQGRNEEARQVLEEALMLARDENNYTVMADVLVNLGDVVLGLGHHQSADMSVSSSSRFQVEAMAYYEESVARQRQLGDEIRTAYSLSRLAVAAGEIGDLHRASSLLLEILQIVVSHSAFAQGVVTTLADLAWAAAGLGDIPRAVRLAGAVSALREVTGISVAPGDHERYERALVATHAQLEDTAWQELWKAGRALTQSEAIGYALDDAQ